MIRVEVTDYLADCRALAVAEIKRMIPPASALGPVLYDLVLDYPLRAAKGLRPALCLATCRALGGSEQAALPTAAVIELYHNAFLIHDDVEDGSLLRRDAPTLHTEHGIPIAINVGDAMLAMAFEPLLENTRLVGLGKALKILQLVGTMARETAEGQAIELDWCRRGTWLQSDGDYVDMVLKKTGWYSFIAPVKAGALVAGASGEQLATLEQFAVDLSVAFQIRDDVLNLDPGNKQYGKEWSGDLWEGKHTLLLLHALRSATPMERADMEEALRRPRPRARARISIDNELLSHLQVTGALTGEGRAQIEAALERDDGETLPCKTSRDVALLYESIQRHGGRAYAQSVGLRHARRAREALDSAQGWLPSSVHRELLHQLIDFTVDRQF